MCPAAPDDRRTEGIAAKFTVSFTPRSKEQASVYANAAERLKRGQSFILQAPTGYGKTVIGCALIGAVGRKALVITTKDDLIEQWQDAARRFLNLSGSEVAVWRADQSPNPDAKLVLGLVQSVLKGPERYPDVDFASFGFVIADESHRVAADQFSQAMWWFPALLRLGLTATPYRKDGREDVFFGHIGPVAVTAKLETLVPSVIMQKTSWRVPMVRRGGGYVPLPHDVGRTMQLSKVMAVDTARNELILRFLQAARAKGRTSIVFADTLNHLQVLYASLLSRGVPAAEVGYYVGLNAPVYSGTEQVRRQDRERSKRLPLILATYQMAAEATDIPWLDTCVLATPRSDVVQIVGRIRREYPDKKNPVVYDLVDLDSVILSKYAERRQRWYRSLGCKVSIY
jgi:superfamily II DNA or RNA helicase